MAKLSEYSFEIGPIRPPSEGGSHSLLIRVTRNCPWSRCKFCFGMLYERENFSLRTVEDVKKDIHTDKLISDEIKQTSWQLVQAGEINEAAARALIRQDPELRFNHSFITVFNWLATGGQTVFLQDADSLVMNRDAQFRGRGSQ